VILNAVAVVLLAVGLVLGTVALRAKLIPEKKKWPETVLPGPTTIIGDQVYNLGEPDRYLKATIVLEVDVEGKTKKEIKLLMEELVQRDPKLRDLIIHEVNARTFREVNSPEGKERLKADLLKKINETLSHGELKRLMFTEFALQ